MKFMIERGKKTWFRVGLISSETSHIVVNFYLKIKRMPRKRKTKWEEIYEPISIITNLRDILSKTMFFHRILNAQW
jgi:hypothetical protein